MDAKKLFEKYVPSNAVEYCFHLWQDLKFDFIVSKARSTKLGDFRSNTHTRKTSVSVNHNLNPYQFLFTYIHEVAHAAVFQKWGRKAEPHGMEWKTTFSNLMQPLFRLKVFPEPLNFLLQKHMRNAKATYGTDLKLTMEFRRYDQQQNGFVLSDIPDGFNFSYKGNTYQKLNTKRTRALCIRTADSAKLLFPLMTEVLPST